MNGKHETRVLGRVLAVEETMHVSGAKPTTPCIDNATSLTLDTSPRSEYCTRTPASNAALIGSSTLPTHTSGT